VAENDEEIGNAAAEGGGITAEEIADGDARVGGERSRRCRIRRATGDRMVASGGAEVAVTVRCGGAAAAAGGGARGV
jgi:hypothetical protein